MNILITSGSIVETIDNVYYMGQKSDESIAALIGEEFAKQNNVDKIFFLYGEKSRFPWESSSSNDQKFFLDEWLDKVALSQILNMDHFTETLDSILSEHNIDVVIHLMSITNYGDTNVHLLKSSEDATTFLHEVAEKFGLEISVTGDAAKEAQHSVYGKMKTGYKRVFLEQQPQPKILERIKKLSPSSFLISGKFEFDVPESSLLQFAKESLLKNGSNLVLASDIEAYKKGDTESYFLIDGKQTAPKSYDSMDVVVEIVERFTT